MRRVLVVCFLVVGLHSPFALGADNDWHNLPPANAMREIPRGIEVRAGSSLIRITALSESVSLRIPRSPDAVQIEVDSAQ